MRKITYTIEPLPSTVNGWGFNGSTNKKRYIFSIKHRSSDKDVALLEYDRLVETYSGSN